MFSQPMDVQFQSYQAELKELKSCLIEEQKCQTALQSANNALKLQTSPLTFTESEMMTVKDEPELIAAIDAAEKKLTHAQQKLASVKKSIDQQEKKLMGSLTDQLSENIIAIQTEQKIAGWSQQSGQVLLETVGQIQEAKSTAQLQMLSGSFLELLKFLSINNDRLNIEPIMANAQMAAAQFESGKPLTKKEISKIMKRMQNMREKFDEKSENLINKLVEDIARHQRELKTLTDPEEIAAKKQLIENLQEGITKIEHLTEKVHAVTDSPLFTQEKLSKDEIDQHLKELNQNMVELSAEATGRSVEDIEREGPGNIGKQTLNACIENCIKLTFIKYTQLMVAENLKNEAGKEMLINAVINSVLTGLSIYTLGNPAADLAKDVQSAISGGKKVRDFSQLDKSISETLMDYIKNNPLKVKVGGPAMLAVATVLFIVFPPTTAIGIVGTILSGASTAGDLKSLMSYLMDEVKNTKEISQSLDKHSELIDALLMEAKTAKVGTELTAAQEAGLLLGKLVEENRQKLGAVTAPSAPKAKASGTSTIFSGLKAKIPKNPSPSPTVAAIAPSSPKSATTVPKALNDQKFAQESPSQDEVVTAPRRFSR